MSATAIRPVIPLVHLGARSPEALAEMHPEGAAELVAAARRMLPGPVLPLLDTLSRRWAARSNNPYREEVARLSARIGTGAWFMNFCFEWGCTTGVAPDPAGPGMRMLRTLDWPFHGVGRHVLVARQQGPAGPFLNVTWPGFVGVVTAMAPGRFALAINQAPLVRRGYLPLAADFGVLRATAHRPLQAADPVARLEHLVVVAQLAELVAHDQAGEARAEDEHPAFGRLPGELGPLTGRAGHEIPGAHRGHDQR